MITNIISIIAAVSILGFNQGGSQVLSSHSLTYANDIFRYNILHTLKIMGDNEIILKPGETFAFHEDVLEKYQGKVVKITKAHFNFAEGFKSDGYLMGDGVCHLASLINMVARQAGLEVESPTNHNFAVIPDIPREYGVSIYSYPGRTETNAMQNLYITNNKVSPVVFKFDYQNDILKLSIWEKTI